MLGHDSPAAKCLNLMSYGLRPRNASRSDAARRTPNVRSFYSKNRARSAPTSVFYINGERERRTAQCQNVALRTVTIFAIAARSYGEAHCSERRSRAGTSKRPPGRTRQPHRAPKARSSASSKMPRFPTGQPRCSHLQSCSRSSRIVLASCSRETSMSARICSSARPPFDMTSRAQVSAWP